MSEQRQWRGYESAQFEGITTGIGIRDQHTPAMPHVVIVRS